MFTFNDEYLLKSMMSLVRSEGKRIVSLGLATEEEVKGFVDPAIRGVLDKFSSSQVDKNVVLGTITDLHQILQSIKLPGDFEQSTLPDDEKICAVIEVDIPVEEVEIVKEDDDEDKEETECVLEKDNNDDQMITAICSFLENMVYKLGKEGNHNAAYLVERTMRKITAKSE